MAGLDIALLTGRSSLLMRQSQMTVTGNNIANADRTGYHRQNLSVTNSAPVQEGNLRLGTGVQVETVMRTYNSALESNLRQTIRQDGYYQTYTSQLEQTEMTLAPDAESPIATAMTEFAASWADIDAQPTSINARSQLITKAQSLTDEINRTRGNLVQLRDGINDGAGRGILHDSVAKTNRLAAAVADLNTQIQTVETRRFNPQQANNLRDQRDELTHQLARLVDISATSESDGTLTLTIGGEDLVRGGTATELAVATPPAGSLVWQNSQNPVDQDAGETQALLDARAYIQSSIDEIDSFADTLATTINTAHANGYDLNGTQGGDIFDRSIPGRIHLALTDPAVIAASANQNQTADSANARAIGEAISTPAAALENDSLLTRADRIVDSVAMDTASSSALADGTEAGIDMFQNAIGEVSGVNLDEEMMTMLETQRAYQASARFVGVVDEMLGSVIQLV